MRLLLNQEDQMHVHSGGMISWESNMITGGGGRPCSNCLVCVALKRKGDGS